jgi:hypothetical protein
MAATPLRSTLLPPGCGVGNIVQVAPFQCSISARLGVPWTFESPTAQMSLALMAAVARSWLMPKAFGLLTKWNPASQMAGVDVAADARRGLTTEAATTIDRAVMTRASLCMPTLEPPTPQSRQPPGCAIAARDGAIFNRT